MNTAPPLRMRDELKAAVDTALPKTPSQFGEQLIKDKWGANLDPQTALLVTLDYDYRGHPEQNGIHQGQIGSSRTLVQTLLSNDQTVGDGRFGETAFGLYTPLDVGPAVRLVEKVDEFADHGSGNHRTYEGIYRQTTPQVYGPETQLTLRPADFKKWVWELDLKYRYENYLDNAWPSDEVLVAPRPYPLRTSVKAAFVMTAWLQHHENSVSQKGLELAMGAAGLPSDQAWDGLTIGQLQGSTRLSANIEAGRLKLYRYTARDIWCYRDRSSGRVLLYIPGNSSPLHEFADRGRLRHWIVEQGKSAEKKQALAAHFAEDDREDGTFHAGVLTTLEGMAIFPRQYHLTKESGFFNNDGYWDPADYIDADFVSSNTDPFAQLVLTMKQAATASTQTIRDDADVNRANLSAFVEPIVQWVNQFGPLALFVPGGEGLLVLAGLIDAGYGVDQALDGKTASQRSEGVTRIVFGLLNALPLANGVGSLSRDGDALAALTDAPRDKGTVEPIEETALTQRPPHAVLPMPTRVDLLRGVGAPAGTFTDEVLAQIGKVSAVDDDMLRLMQAGRAPTPLLKDTIVRFRIDQEVAALGDPLTAQAEFNRRYQVVQQSDHPWVRLFQKTYPDLPKTAVEQMLDRYGVDFKATPAPEQARELFKQLDGKARQYQQHVRLNRAYEGLYLRSVSRAESDTLALHSLRNLPGWPKGLRIEVLEGSLGGRVLDRVGPIDSPDCLRLIKVQERYQSIPAAAATNVYEAIATVLSSDERSALQLLSANPGAELKLKISDHALSRSEFVSGLGRMDSRLAFEPQGLKGGGFPATPQDEALTQAIKRIQLREVYPELTDADADGVLARVGSHYIAHIDRLKVQLRQLTVDMNDWVGRVAVDINDMGVPLLDIGDQEAAGMSPAQLAAHNAALIQDAMTTEVNTRMELADELVSVWRKRPPQAHSRYSGNHTVGFTMNLDHENFHRLPALSVRLNDVVGLNMHNFQMNVVSSLDEFLEAFPNVQTLNLEGVDLRFDIANVPQAGELPVTIPDLRSLTSLILRDTHLTLSELTAGKLSELTRLQVLDMSDNPLGVPPVVLGMNRLHSLNLNNTGITTCPVGIADQPYLTLLDLRDNQISRVPQAILNQAISRDRVLLWHNPITDEDTLRRLVQHREKTGVNLWVNSPGNDRSDPAVWLSGIQPGPADAHLQAWQRLALKHRGPRFLGTMSALTLTPDFQVNYLDLQTRMWRLLTEADASDELWGRLSQDVRLPAGAFDNPFAAFTALEDRARLYNDWVALGRPFPAGGEAS
ncbi:leucine-rich repeat domain-containing protein [Pseudomonas sp. GB2N2]